MNNQLIKIGEPRFKDTQDTALILEGGGFRGIYTAGILDRFLEENIHFPYVVGVSMGAIIGMCYVADQRERMIEWCSRYVPDKNYMSVNNLIKEGNFFSHDYGFNREARRFFPFDFKSFYAAPEQFWFGTTNIETGKAQYFEKSQGDVVHFSLATSALPMFSQYIKVGDQKVMDGGIVNGIPLDKPLSDGYSKIVAVLTQPKGFRRGKYIENKLVERFYKNYPNMIEDFHTRTDNYNLSLDILDQMEKEGKAFIFRLNDDSDAALIQRNPSILRQNYQFGYDQADFRMNDFKEFLRK